MTWNTARVDRRLVVRGIAVSFVGIAAGACARAAPEPQPTPSARASNARTSTPIPHPFTNEEALTPEMFGAKGDGRTNDTEAFTRLADAVTRKGGARIALAPRKTYVVGTQTRALRLDPGYAFTPARLLEFDGLARGLVIEGNGATMRAAPGLRYGSFDRATGEPLVHKMPFTDSTTVAAPYTAMIAVTGSRGPVVIRDVVLDGNLTKMHVGGGYGDTGIQIEGSGIFLRDNRGDEILENVHTHHHPQDGLMIDGLDDTALAKRVTRRASKVRCDYNGRQGCSLVGGRGWSFEGCAFNHTGRAGIESAPAAGFDIEAEGDKTNRGHRFSDCEFIDNAGNGMVADSGDSADCRFTDCRFVGTTIWSLWSAKPYFRFERCMVVGTAVRPFGDPNPARATQFVDCTFTDDPKQSPNGKVYREGRADGPLFDLSDEKNVLFDRCRMVAVAGAVLPWSTGAIYRDCTMRQGFNSIGYPRGTYQGRSTITGKVALYGSKFPGTVEVNGKSYRP